MATSDLHDSKTLSMTMASPRLLKNRHSKLRTFSDGQWICLKSLSRMINTCIDCRLPQSRYQAQFRRLCLASLTVNNHEIFFRPASCRKSYRNNKALKVILGSAPSYVNREQILLRFRNVQAIASAFILTLSNCRDILIDETLPGSILQLPLPQMFLFRLQNPSCRQSQSLYKK